MVDCWFFPLLDSVVSVFRGWGRGYHRLAESHAASVAGDALVGVALAGTLLFSVPSTEARENVAVYSPSSVGMKRTRQLVASCMTMLLVHSPQAQYPSW